MRLHLCGIIKTAHSRWKYGININRVQGNTFYEAWMYWIMQYKWFSVQFLMFIPLLPIIDLFINGTSSSND